MNDHARPDRTELNALMRKAEDGAGFAMRSIGSVPPTFLAATPSGLLTFIPNTMADERAKDNRANTARLICAAYAAAAVVLMFEAWMRLAPPGDDGPTGARPPTPRRDGLERGSAQRNAVQQLNPATACMRFRGGPRSGARNRDGAARPPPSAEETDLKSAEGDGDLALLKAPSPVARDCHLCARRFSSSKPRIAGHRMGRAAGGRLEDRQDPLPWVPVTSVTR